jgi:hypothetical protein
MRIVFVLLFTLGFAACGVKKAPDAYYTHPLLFDDAPLTHSAPSATPSPSGMNP